MSTIVQINFPYTEDNKNLREGAGEVAPVFAGMDGLLWKVWLVDEARRESGGIYLFSTRAQAEKYLASDIVAHLRSVRPGISIKLFDTLDAPGMITRAPVPTGEDHSA